MIKVKVKKINADAILPKQANEFDAGHDICAVCECVIPSGGVASVKTGLCLELPRGTEAQIRPRSGLAKKFGITVLNSPGTIDAGYRGEIEVLLINHGKQDFAVEKGMRIAQMVVKPIFDTFFVETDVLEDSERGENGFGSSGMKG